MAVEPLLGDHDQLTRFHLSNIFGIEQVKGTGLRRHHPAAAKTPDTQRPEPIRIARGDETIVGHQDNRKRAPHLTQRIDDTREKGVCA